MRSRTFQPASVTSALLSHVTVCAHGWSLPLHVLHMRLHVCVRVFYHAGISIGLVVCTAGVHNGELTVGDVVLFLSLMAQVWIHTHTHTRARARVRVHTQSCNGAGRRLRGWRLICVLCHCSLVCSYTVL